jgi:hypothetical protein
MPELESRRFTNGTRCRHCTFLADEHDPIDMRCPDDEDHARANREEWSDERPA